MHFKIKQQMGNFTTIFHRPGGMSIRDMETAKVNPHGFREGNYCFYGDDRENIFKITHLPPRSERILLEGIDEGDMFGEIRTIQIRQCEFSDLRPIDLSTSWLVNFGLVPHPAEGDRFFGLLDGKQFEVYFAVGMGPCVEFFDPCAYLLTLHVHTLQNAVTDSIRRTLRYTPEI